MNKQTIKKFTDRCKQKCGFSLPAIYSRFITRVVNINVINTVIYENNIDMPGSITTVSNFIKFLYNMNVCLEKVLGEDYSVEVFNSLDFMDEWSFNKHSFTLCKHGNLVKLPHIEQSIVIKLTLKHCGSPTTKIYSQWESIFNTLNQDHKNVLDTYKFVTGEHFPEVTTNILIQDNMYQYYLQLFLFL